MVGGKAAGKGAVHTERPPVLQARVILVTTLVEDKKAQLVPMTHNVDSIELMAFLLALCGKMEVLTTSSRPD